MSYLRIAAEEAFAPPELIERYRRLLAAGGDLDPGFVSLWGHYSGTSAQASALLERIQQSRPTSASNNGRVKRQTRNPRQPELFE